MRIVLEATGASRVKVRSLLQGQPVAVAPVGGAAPGGGSVSARPTVDDWISAVPSLRRVGGEHHGPCPACGGTDRFRVLDDGAAFCRQCAPEGGAGFKRLLQAAGLNGSTDKVRNLPVGGAGTTTEYEIRDTAGKLVAVHGRRDKLIGKDLWWKLPDGTSGLNGTPAKTLPLYRSQHLPDTKATAICIVEGEKAADALAAAVPSLLVLGTITGAAGTPAADVLQPVADAGLRVYLWPDADDEGAQHMQRIGAVLDGAGADVRVLVDAPPDTKGADAADWARLTDRPPWESLTAGAVAPGEVKVAAPAGISTRPTKNGLDAQEIALKLALQHAGKSMYVHGRGWFTRAADAALWCYDGDGRMVTAVQDHPLFLKARKGTSARNIVTEMQGQLTVAGDDLDSDDWLAGLPGAGGVLDLRTGAVRAATGDDRITMTLGAVPDEGEPELWLKVLRETFAACADPSAIVEYVRGWFRMALTGDCSQESMLFMFGPPGTGKSIVADTLLHVAGGYGVTVAAEHLVGESHHHRAWLARLDRRRLVRVVEVPARGAWNTTEVLPLVSGETISANRMRQDPFDFRSRAHLLCTGNHQPYASSGSGLWRRFRPVDCRHLPAAPDETLRDQLRAEYGRILAWALAAPIKLPASPDEMKAGAEHARTERDPVGAWLDEHYQPDSAGVTPSAEMYERYCETLSADKLPTIHSYGYRLTEKYGAPFTCRVDGRPTKARRCSPVVRALF